MHNKKRYIDPSSYKMPMAQRGKEMFNKIFGDLDDEYDYRINDDGNWEAKLKDSPDDDWVELSVEEVSEKGLDSTYPDAQKIVEEANEIEGNTLTLNEENLKFISPESANLFSGVGDTNILDLIYAGVQVGKSFGKDQYYDPGKASDYRKYTFENTSDEDMYIDEDAFMQGKKQSEVFGTKDEIAEQRIQSFLDERHRRNPQKYAKVKDFDIEEYRETGDVDYRQGPFGLFESEGKQGDLLEQRDNADAIGFTLDKRGRYDEPIGYTKDFYDDGTPKAFDIYDDGSIELNTEPLMQIEDSIPFLQTKPLEEIQSGGEEALDSYYQSWDSMSPSERAYARPDWVEEKDAYNRSLANWKWRMYGKNQYEELRNFFNSIGNFGFRYGLNLPQAVVPGGRVTSDNRYIHNPGYHKFPGARPKDPQTGRMPTIPLEDPGRTMKKEIITSNIQQPEEDIDPVEATRRSQTVIHPDGSTTMRMIPYSINLGDTGDNWTGQKDDPENFLNPNEFAPRSVYTDLSKKEFAKTLVNPRKTKKISSEQDADDIQNFVQGMYGYDNPNLFKEKPNRNEFQAGGQQGYNPLTNIYTPPNFELDPETQYNMQTLNLGDISSPDDTRFMNSQDRMYATQQAVNRSMDDYESATEQTMDKFNNPFSIENTQTSLDLPSSNAFETDQFTNDAFYSKDMRTSSTDEIDVDDLDSRSDRRALRKYRRQLKREDRRNERAGRDGVATRAYNTGNMILDSKPAQIYGKIGSGAVTLSRPINRLIEQKQERERLKTMMDNAYLSDNVFASVDADVAGFKGDYDVNTGIFRPDDKVISRQGKYGAEISNYLTFAKNGGSFFNDGDEVEVDANMYKELIAAGAELEII